MNIKKRLYTTLIIIIIISSCTAPDYMDKANQFRLDQVELLEGPFKNAMERNREYIMQMDPDRLLAPYLREAGLPPKAQPYGNWESGGVDGHTGGHYLTALSLLYASTGDLEALDRLNYMLDELENCQQQYPDGYIGGIPGGYEMWQEIAVGDISAAPFSLNGKWVPWYNIHKLFAGLYDAYFYTGSTQARDMLLRLTVWAEELVSELDDDQLQDMLRSEHGGINEVFANIYAISGDDNHLELAERFSDRRVLDPLLEGRDELDGMHANTQIPKVVGFKRIGDISGYEPWQEAADFFWEAVVEHRSVSIGGHSVREHFHPRDDFSVMITDREGPETCNTYNMLKLTSLLFLSSADPSYMDYYERALYNHILSSQHPEHGGLVYFTSMRPRHYRVYSQPEENFWCCVGTGIENHMKYGEMIYAHTGSRLLVNLYIPSRLNWEEKGVIIEQQTLFPDEETMSFVIETEEPVSFEISVRIPGWLAGDIPVLYINGEFYENAVLSGGYVNADRLWENGDKLDVYLPMDTYFEQLPDDSPYYSILHGPVVMAAKTDTTDLTGLIADDSRMGHVAWGTLYPLYESPTLVGSSETFLAGIQQGGNGKLSLQIPDNIYPQRYRGIELEPFFRVHDARYVVYWPMADQEELERMIAARAELERIDIELEVRTIDQVAAGEQQPESEHGFRGHLTETGIHQNRLWRHAHGWFSYDLRDEDGEASELKVTYYGGDSDRNFDILINDVRIAQVVLDGSKGDKFFRVSYPVPEDIVREAKDGVLTVKFEAHEGSIAGGVYHVRLLRAEQ